MEGAAADYPHRDNFPESGSHRVRASSSDGQTRSKCTTISKEPSQCRHCGFRRESILLSYEMMMACWREDPTARPSFDALSQWLDSIILEHSGFDHLNMDVNPERDIYMEDEDSEEEDIIQVLPGRMNEGSHLTTQHQILPMTDGDRDLNFTTSSADSGYISAQKCSVSSGESSTNMAQTAKLSASSENDTSHNRMNSETSGKHAFGQSVEDIMESESIPEDGFDDVFQEGVAMDTNFPTFSHTAIVADLEYRNVDGLSADYGGDDENDGPRGGFLFDASRILKRTFSDSVVKELVNFESPDKDNFGSHCTLRRLYSTPLEYTRNGWKAYSRFLVRDMSLGPRSISKRSKAAMQKKRGQRTRRNAVVIPPTLAMDNDFYFRFNKEKQQLPPPTRIPRKTRHLETSETGKNSKLKEQLKETVSINIPLASDRNSLQSRRRRKSSIYQYIVFADVHNSCEANGECSHDRTTSFDVKNPDQSDARPKEIPLSPHVKKTFVKLTDSVRSNCNSLKDERDQASFGDLQHCQHQYTDFNDILKHIFSPTRWQFPNSRAFIFNSDQCLTEQGDSKQKTGSPSESFSPHQRSFSEDGALDLYGLDRFSLKDSPLYLSVPKGFFDLLGQTPAKSRTDSGFQDNLEDQAEKLLTSVNDHWPVHHHERRRLSDPFST